jgi:Flp pilus assembly protein protease CpaA
LPVEWVVVCSTEVVGARLTDSECVVVVVVVGAGFSTTVVHEVRATAIARTGVRMISFFIVFELFLQGRIGAGSSPDCISDENFSGWAIDPGRGATRERA